MKNSETRRKLTNLSSYLHSHSNFLQSSKTAINNLHASSTQAPSLAAVMMPIILSDTCDSLLLTQRSDTLKSHAGQISFPGGRLDTEDETLLDCALRETHEEVGIHKNKINIVGSLGDWHSQSGFLISVYIGLINAPLSLKACEQEVAEIFEVPIDFVLEPTHYEKIDFKREGQDYSYYQIQYQGKRIWGFTAGMMYLLSRILNHN